MSESTASGAWAGWDHAAYSITHVSEVTTDAAGSSHQLKFDSVHGTWDVDCSAEAQAMIEDVPALDLLLGGEARALQETSRQVAITYAIALLVVLVIAGLLLTEIGLIYGTASKDVTGVFTLIKGTGFILLGPTIFYIFPDWPQWIAKLFPTYWVINPVYEVTINGAGLGGVWVELAIAVAVIVVMIVPLRYLINRLEMKLAIAG